MHKKLLTKIAILLIASLVLSMPFMGVAKADIPNWDFPRVDELLFTIKYPYTVSLEAAKACTIDTYIGAIRTLEVDTLKNPPYSWTVTAAPGFHMCYVGINCRGVTIDTSGTVQDYHGRLPGDKLYPLEIPAFRYALELIVGCEKDAWISEIYGPINVRLDTCVPPASAYWYNPGITPYPQDWVAAADILHAAGFTGTPGVDGWIMPNGVPLDDREVNPRTHEKGILVMSPEAAPTSVEVTRRHVAKWNLFFTGKSVNPPPGSGTEPFKHEPIDSSIEIDVAFINRDHDMYMLCWGLSRDPSYLYDFFHPDMDLPDGSNSPGLNYRPLNILIKSFYLNMWYEYIEKRWIGPGPMTVPASTTTRTKNKFVACTEELWIGQECANPGFPWYLRKLVKGTDYEVITDPAGNGVSIHFLKNINIPDGYYIHIVYKLVTPIAIVLRTDLRDICYEIQEMLYYACPYLPIYSRNYHDLYKPGLTCWVPSLGYGSGTYQLKWTYASIHWAGTPVGGSIKWHDPGAVYTLHPWKRKWVYEATITNRLYEGMLEVDAYTHADIPWVASGYRIEPWTGPSGEPGMIIQWYLRDDVYWQDGDHVTADDMIWQYEFINSIQAPEYYALWSTYHGCIKYNDYAFGIRVNATGVWKFYDYTMGPTYPRKVWGPYYGNKAAAEAFMPWKVSYQTGTGCPPPPDKPRLTCEYGTSEWVFDYWDEVLGIIRVYKNNNYWARWATKSQQCNQLAELYPDTPCGKNIIEPMDIEYYNPAFPPEDAKHQVVDLGDGVPPPEVPVVPSHWHEDYPQNYWNKWEIANPGDWVDSNANGKLDYCDMVRLTSTKGFAPIWAHVGALVHGHLYNVTVKIHATNLEDKQLMEFKFKGDIEWVKGPDHEYGTPDDWGGTGTPVGTKWIEIKPQFCNSWQIIGWTDNGNGYFDYCDMFVMQPLDPTQTEPIGPPVPFHLERIATAVWLTPTATNVVIPKITRAGLGVDVVNLDTKNDCTFTWEIFMDDTVRVASGGPVTLAPLGVFAQKVRIPTTLPPCIHTWKLVVHAATGDNVYTIKAAYLIGDVTCDSLVDLRDIFKMIIYFGESAGPPPTARWNDVYDLNLDGIVDLRDIFIAIMMYGKTCAD